jgi:hypothetical protein
VVESQLIFAPTGADGCCLGADVASLASEEQQWTLDDVV